MVKCPTQGHTVMHNKVHTDSALMISSWKPTQGQSLTQGLTLRGCSVCLGSLLLSSTLPMALWTQQRQNPGAQGCPASQPISQAFLESVCATCQLLLFNDSCKIGTTFSHCYT